MTSSVCGSRDLPEFGEDEARVYIFRLDVTDAAVTVYETALSPDELARASRYRFAADRRRYVVARGRLRSILANCLRVPANEVTFDYGKHGKPCLSRLHDTCIEFNLSHSDDFAAIAVTKNVRVGIDIECGRALTDCRNLAARFFHASEIAELDRLSDVEYRRAFLRAWTRKEALLKAMGTGLYTSLSECIVSLLPDEPPSIRRAPDGGRWTVRSLDTDPACAGALVTEGDAPMQISFMEDIFHMDDRGARQVGGVL